MRIGFIGLGIMGKPMCKNLLKAGYDVVCFDMVTAAMDDVVSVGGKAAASVAEVAKQCSQIVTMLPNSPHVEAVALGQGGILENAAAGTLVIDMSSIAPLASRAIHDGLEKKGIRMIDAPVSGGEPKAINGTLSVMVGGAQKDFDEALPIMEKMASSVIRVGEIGAGNAVKLANQIIAAVNMAGLSEAMTLLMKIGVDPELAYKAIRGGAAGSTMMELKMPMILDRDIKPGFKINLHIKDMANVMETGHGIGAPLPLSSCIMEMMQALRVDGMGDADNGALIRYYEKLANIEVKRKN